MTCNCCQITNDQFNEDRARDDLKEYRRKGPAKHTRFILDAIRSMNVNDMSLLDVGGGVGAIYHELLGRVARQAVHVDASSAYLSAAKEETKRIGNDGKVEFIHADFTDVAADLPEADVVTLDRVVCCYPDFRNLLKSAAGRGRRVIAMTYPQDIWFFRQAVKAANMIQKLRKNPFRIFVHPVVEMEKLLKAEGFTRAATRRMVLWEMALYQRS